MERANSRAAAINADRLRAAKPGNDSKGREKKRRRKNDRLPQMEKGEGRDRVASHGGGAAGGVAGTRQLRITLEEGEQRQLL